MAPSALSASQLDLVDNAAVTDSTTEPDAEAGKDDHEDQEEAAEEEQADDVEGNDDDQADEEAPSAKSTTKPSTGAPAASVRQVARETAEAYAKEAGGLLFFEASAKTGQGVQELFTEIGERIASLRCNLRPRVAGC